MQSNNRSLSLGFVLLGLALFPQFAAAGAQPDCLKLKKIETPNDALQPGASYAMILGLETTSGDCGILLKTAGQSLDHPVSTKLEVPSGLQAEWTGESYDKLDRIPGAATRLKLGLNVTALSQLPPGNYTIAAVLSYDAMDNHGVIYPHQQTTLQIPVKVTSAKAEQQPKNRWWEPLLMIPLIPLWILGSIFGLYSDC